VHPVIIIENVSSASKGKEGEGACEMADFKK
jgi:hypothetical protein